MDTVSARLRATGRAFQSSGALAEKALPPWVTKLILAGSSRALSADLRQRAGS